MNDIRKWLVRHGLAQHAEAFGENGVDLDVLPQLSEDDLKDLGLNLGDRRRFQAALERAPGIEAAKRTAPEAPITPTTAGEAERRQLTVMFCDLVGSVELGERMDLEDYRDLLARFRNAVVVAVERYEGFVARHQGDGLLVYFGYPRAHESDAEQAVRAGLEVVRSVAALEHPYDAKPETRVGIATGLTVVGDALSTGSTEELGAFGSTPNLAARLQGHAGPNSVLISQTTAKMTWGCWPTCCLYRPGVDSRESRRWRRSSAGRRCWRRC